MSEVQTDSRYLIFRVGNEKYGAKLLAIREVLEYIHPKFVPNMNPMFSGVVNIRGAIVSVVDLRRKLQRPVDVGSKTCLLVVDTDQGVIASVVDMIESVASILPEHIQEMPASATTFDAKYLEGIAKVGGEQSQGDQLITLIDLRKFLGTEKFTTEAA